MIKGRIPKILLPGFHLVPSRNLTNRFSRMAGSTVCKKKQADECYCQYRGAGRYEEDRLHEFFFDHSCSPIVVSRKQRAEEEARHVPDIISVPFLSPPRPGVVSPVNTLFTWSEVSSSIGLSLFTTTAIPSCGNNGCGKTCSVSVSSALWKPFRCRDIRR